VTAGLLSFICDDLYCCGDATPVTAA